MNEHLEEILESIWACDEIKNHSIEAIRKRCAVDFDDDNLLTLEKMSLIIRHDDKLELTPKGRAIAKGIIRRHRLAEVLVTSILMVKHADMEDMACRIEHSLLPEVEESICTLLGHPEVCPDGKPIPKGNCCANELKVIDNKVFSLFDLEAGDAGKITYIKPISHSNFHQLISFGLQPGVEVTIHRKSPAFCIKFENTELALDAEIVKNIYVWKLSSKHQSGSI